MERIKPMAQKSKVRRRDRISNRRTIVINPQLVLMPSPYGEERNLWPIKEIERWALCHSKESSLKKVENAHG